MCDLSQACEAHGLDSRKYRPLAHALPDGRFAVYIGAAYAHLPRGAALNLRDQLTRALEADRHAAPPVDENSNAAAPFDVQLQQWRLGNRRTPPMPERGDARLADLERRALAEITGEARS